MFMRLNLTILAISFLLTSSLFAFDRVVLLSPAAGDIMQKLHLEKKVVGITKHMKGFPNAVKVGSHLRPNIEIIKSLNPDLIIISSTRFFSKAMNNVIKSEIFNYNPHTLDGIIRKIKQLGKLFDKNKEASVLIDSLKNKLANVEPLSRKPKVIYEVMQTPYIVSGQTDIITDIISKAGGVNIVTVKKRHVRYSYEKVLTGKPDIYFYQVGPMNKNPVPPEKREYFKDLKAEFIKINEKDFARPNTKSFNNVLKINAVFKKWADSN